MPLKNKKDIPRPPYFEKGDIISIQIQQSKFVYALAFDKEVYGIEGNNRFVFSSLITRDEITIQEFLDSDVLYLDKGGKDNYYRGYFWADFNTRNMKGKIKLTKLIGNESFDDYLWLSNAMPGGDWNHIADLYNEQIAYISRNKSGRPFNISIKEFIKGENQELELKLEKHADLLWVERLEAMKRT